MTYKRTGRRLSTAPRLFIHPDIMDEPSFGRPLALGRVQLLFAQADRLGCYFNQFVVVDELQGLLQCQHARRGELDGVVRAGGAHVGELLPFAGVDVQVVVLGVLADDHATVDLDSGADEEYAARLEGIQGVGRGFAVLHGHQHAVLAAGDVTLVGGVFVEGMGHDRSAAGVGQDLAPQADQAPGRDDKFQPDHIAHGGHGHHIALAWPHLLDDGALVLGSDIHHQVFHRLHLLAVLLADDDLRLGYCQFKSLAAHVLDQNRKVQLAAARDLEGVGAVGVLHPQGDVGAQLLDEAIADVAGGDPFPFPSGKGGGVDDKVHGQGRLIDGNVGNCDGRFGGCQCLADAHLFETGHGDDIAGASLLDIHLFESFVAEQFGDAAPRNGSVSLDHGHGLPGLDLAVEDAAGGHAAYVVVVIDVGDQHLEGGAGVTLGWADVG